MPSEASLQHKLDRVRRPRVQITYDVETNGSPIKRELPFVLGVIADLAGTVDGKRPPLSERDFVEINRDTFGKVMRGIAPKLALSVPNELQRDGTKLGFELEFESMEDFEPENIVMSDPRLRKLLEARRRLSDLKSKVVSNNELESVLRAVLKTTEEMKKSASEAGGGPEP